MTIDCYMTEAGDITRDASGDIALTTTPWRDDVQQIYIRVMTDIGDYVLYPTMGADLSQLYGMPQSPKTAQLGVNLIQAALDRDTRFATNRVVINAVPTGYQTIRFDISITSGSQQLIRLSVAQTLGLF